MIETPTNPNPGLDYGIHVCLVSQQATPNLIPVLDSRTRPREVVLVVSPDMRERAKWLHEAFAARGIRVSECLVADAWDIASVQEALLNLLVRRDGETLALNVTGGTKPMAMAAQEVFRAGGHPVFYVHPERNEIIPLWPRGESIRMEDRVEISEYLAVHGFRELSRDKREFADGHHLLCDEWVKEVERFGEPLRRVNGLAAKAKGVLRVGMGRSTRDDRVREVLDKLDRYGIATVEGETLTFPDEASRFFANGGWLELHVARVIEGLREVLGSPDTARSLQVESGDGVRNEIDVAFLSRNRLFLVECKSRRMQGDAQDGPGPETLYKLDSLTALGGLNTRGLLVSYQNVDDWDRKRAKELRIKIVQAGELRNLARHVREWTNTSS